MRTILLGLALLVLFAVPVIAETASEQCEIASMQIDRAFGKRFDRQAAQVRSMATQARSLQKQGKHAEALKVYEAAAKAGNIQLTHPMTHAK
jgi:hypothetical protein